MSSTTAPSAATPQADLDRRGLGMADDIAHGLLSDPVEVAFVAVVEQRQGVGVEVDLDAQPAGPAPSARSDGAEERRRSSDGGRGRRSNERSRPSADRAHRFADLGREIGAPVGGGEGATRDGIRGGDELRGAVVQAAGDPAPLVSRR